MWAFSLRDPLRIGIGSRYGDGATDKRNLVASQWTWEVTSAIARTMVEREDLLIQKPNGGDGLGGYSLLDLTTGSDFSEY